MLSSAARERDFARSAANGEENRKRANITIIALSKRTDANTMTLPSGRVALRALRCWRKPKC
jgi:hypothetical protein